MKKKTIIVSILIAATFLIAGCGARQSSNTSGGSTQSPGGGTGTVTSNQSAGQQVIDQTLQSLDQEMGSVNSSLDGSDLN